MLTSFVKIIKHLISEHNLDEKRIWNLDECVVTPRRDKSGGGGGAGA